MGRLKELLITQMEEPDETYEDQLVGYVRNKINEIYKLIDNNNFATLENELHDLNSGLEAIKEHLSLLTDRLSGYTLSISRYESIVASNQANIDNEVYSDCNLYDNLEGIDIDEYIEKRDEVLSKVKIINSDYEELIQRRDELSKLLIKLEQES